ncbi:MAG: DNA-directed RNA polymerase subunit beta, partial [Oscillospiraceae bacterium]|nr:DNA-directed RNA polymerase subunit beta [Oscillospiraceae bacterium]
MALSCENIKVKPQQLGNTERMSFSRIDDVMAMPNLIEIQKNSYKWFLETGLKEVFRDISTIEDYTGNLVLDFVGYRLENTPKYSVKECKERDVTYAAPLRVKARLFNKETGEVKEQEIFMGDFPLMTDSGTFVINGAERVIVSQLVRSPGAYFSNTYDKTGKKLFASTLIPNRGAWLEYETDSSDVFYVRIDKNRKIPVTTFVRALGLGSDEEIRAFFGEDDRIEATIAKDSTKTVEEGLLETYRKLRPGEPPTVESSQSHINGLFFDPRRYDMSRCGRYKFNKKLKIEDRIAGEVASRDVIAPLTGELLVAAGETITPALAAEVQKQGVSLVHVVAEGDKEVKVISNGMVYAQDFVNFDPLEYGINEMVCFAELRAILEEANGDEEMQKELFEKNRDKLIPKNITIDDI